MNSWSNFCLHDDRPKGILTKGIIHCWVIVRIKIPQFHCPVYLNVFLMKYNWFITAFLKTSHIYIHCTVNLICKYSLYGSKNPPLKHNVYILPKIRRKSNKCLRIKHLLFILAKSTTALILKKSSTHKQFLQPNVFLFYTQWPHYQANL